MKAIDDLFHTALHSLSLSNDVNLEEAQRSYSSSIANLSNALDMQDAIMKHMKRIATIQVRATRSLTTTPTLASQVQCCITCSSNNRSVSGLNWQTPYEAPLM